MYFKRSSMMEQSKNNKINEITKQKKNISINFSPFKIDQLKNMCLKLFLTITEQQAIIKIFYNKLTNFAGDDLLDIV